MSEALPFQTQRQRWIKYGANVVLATMVVLLLAGIVVYLAQRDSHRVDTTAAGMYSLKPQTINIIKNLKSKVKLVSLYTNVNSGVGVDANNVAANTVADLLEEYRRKGSNIEVEVIDPVANPTKVDDLVAEVTQKYGGEVTKYKAAVDEFKAVYAQLKELVDAEQPKIAKLPINDVSAQQSQTTLALQSVQDFPAILDDLKRQVEQSVGERVPNYRAATTSIQKMMQRLAEVAGLALQAFAQTGQDSKISPEVKQYVAQSTPTYQQIKSSAEAMVAKTGDLGELKLDDLRQKLRERNAILVLGEKDMRSISAEQAWRVDDTELRRYAGTGGKELRPSFAGEQQITTAILALTMEKKPKVAIVRPGGPPVASPGYPPFQQSGPLALIAQRLRDYNFEVVEKDLSGQWYAQAQARSTYAEPEPSDEEIKDAIWIVLDMPRQGPESPSVTPKLKEHLERGGSALVLMFPQAEKMTDALAPWGVEARTDVVAVHESTEAPAGTTEDSVEQARRIPVIFVVNDYGDHPIATPLKSLDGLLLPMLIVKTTPTAGYKSTPLIPIPKELSAWGEVNDAEGALNGQKASFDPSVDLAQPLFAGAAVEKEGGGRLVAIGSMEFATNRIVAIKDREMAARGVPVARFPGNAELIANSIFWLSKLETMIAISPAAMEVSRIRAIPPAQLRAWRIGALLVGLPGTVVLAGMMVYFMRRD